MTKALPFTAAGLARAIREATAAGKKIVGVRSHDGSLILEGDPTEAPLPAFLYFVRDGELVQSGYRTNWQVRLATLQAANARPLVMLALFNGTQAEEFALHQRFAAHRIRPNNEWFRESWEITEYLEERGHECLLPKV